MASRDEPQATVRRGRVAAEYARLVPVAKVLCGGGSSYFTMGFVTFNSSPFSCISSEKIRDTMRCFSAKKPAVTIQPQYSLDSAARVAARDHLSQVKSVRIPQAPCSNTDYCVLGLNPDFR